MTWLDEIKERTHHITTPRELWDDGVCWERDVRKLIRSVEVLTEQLEAMGVQDVVKRLEQVE